MRRARKSITRALTSALFRGYNGRKLDKSGKAETTMKQMGKWLVTAVLALLMMIPAVLAGGNGVLHDADRSHDGAGN